MNKKSIAIILVIALTSTMFAGCNNVLGKSVLDYPLEPQLSEKEVVDYYKEALSFDTIVTKNLNVQQVSYETKEVTEDKKNELQTLTHRVEDLLGAAAYDKTSDKLLNESTYNYIKAYLNDQKLTNGEIKSVAEALGFYFIDVEYDIMAGTIGTLKPSSSMLGIHGAFQRDYLGNDSINTNYVTKAVNNINKHYVGSGINKSVYYDRSNQSLKMNGDQILSMDFIESTVVDNTTAESSTSSTKPVSTSTRVPQVNTIEFNSTAGASATVSAYMPKLDLVYTAPGPDGTISGIGAYPSGDGGLRQFGFNRSQISGKVTLRYVFKANTENPKEILGVNVYPVNSELTSGINTNTDNVIVPDFLLEEFRKVVERSDRAIANVDLSALMSGSLYSDVGMAILTGYQSQYCNILRNVSTVRRVIARSTTDNSYLLEVETIRQEGPKGIQSCGVYRDKKYVVVKQMANEFVITDSIVMTRSLTNEPPINPDSAVEKRLAALNLAGEVSEENKKDIAVLMQELYTAGSARILHGPQEVKIDGKKVKIERGMYDCFNSDTTMLSKNRKEYINSTLRNILVKNGVNTPATYNGTIAEWIGGADNQVEFTTEELATYGNKNTGHYMRVYYLASKMGDKWVIDDMKIIESEDKTGDELKQIVSRISSK